ncbi:MAG: zinc ribbon domain-containing protein [Muribaculaceae bacterium]|nr:zinc ribbon domain-containing protein [Muribaculaceae bacterium]
MSYCRSCGGPLSDQNRFCPRCGTPNPDFFDPNQPKKSNTGLWIGLSCLGAVIIGVVVFFILSQLSDKKSSGQEIQDEVVVASESAMSDSAAVPPALAVEEAPVVKEKTYENGLYGENITMKGKIDGYPVTFEFKISRNGEVSGRYSYDSTIRKYGKKASNYFKIYGSLYDNGSRMDLVDYLPKDDSPHHNMELWVSQSGSHFNVSGTIYNNTNGEVYDLQLKK